MTKIPQSYTDIGDGANDTWFEQNVIYLVMTWISFFNDNMCLYEYDMAD